MCLGMEYIHSKKILHRDIKTLNVFLSRDESLRIGDLGVAKRLMSTAAFAHTIVGTPYYLSPELCEDKPYNIKSDMWALGCVLYELCTLKHPFEANNQAALFMKIIRAQYVAPSESYSQDLRRILAGCLMRDYRKRPSCEDILRTPGMRERALGLNIIIPPDSVLNSAAGPNPTPPPVPVSEPFFAAKNALPVIIEEEKVVKRPNLAEEKRIKPQAVVVNPAYAREFPKPKPAAPAVPAPLAVVDIKLGVEQVKKQLPKSNERGVKPAPKPGPAPVSKADMFVPAPVPAPKLAPSPSQKQVKPVQRVIKPASPQPKLAIPRVNSIQPNVPGKIVARPSSAVPRNKEELEDIKSVEELPKRPNVNDIRTPEVQKPVAVQASPPDIKTAPWKPVIARPVSARNPPSHPVIESEESSEEEIDGNESPEAFLECDWNVMGTMRTENLPTFQSDGVRKQSFKVNYRDAATDDSSDIDTDEIDSLSNSQITTRHRDMILKNQLAIQQEIESKRTEAVDLIGQRSYQEMMAFLQGKVESEELMNMEQEDLNSFMLSRIEMKDTPVGPRQVMGILYQIIALEIRLTDCKEKLRLIDEVLGRA